MKKIAFFALSAFTASFATNEFEVTLGVSQIPKTYDLAGVDNPELGVAASGSAGDFHPVINLIYSRVLLPYASAGAGFSFFSGTNTSTKLDGVMDLKVDDEVSETKLSYYVFGELRAPYKWSPFIRLGYGLETISHDVTRIVNDNRKPGYSDKFTGTTNGFNTSLGMQFPLHQFEKFNLRGIFVLDKEYRSSKASNNPPGNDPKQLYGDEVEFSAQNGRTAKIAGRNQGRVNLGVVADF
jgi:hypothetical protein